MDIQSKICLKEKLVKIRKDLFEQGKKVVFTNGCFDILHRGHVEYLEKARLQGDALFIGLNSDESVRRLKGDLRPIMPEEDRAYILASLAMVDYIAIFEEDTPLKLIEALQPDILIKGGDYRVEDIVGREFVEQHGGKVITIPLLPNRSTSNIIEKLTALV